MARIENQKELLAEVKEKESRVYRLLERIDCQSLLITRRENFAWLSCGGRAVVSYVTDASPVFLLITPVKKYAIGYNMDVPRTMDEELLNQDYEPISLSTLGKSPLEAALDLAEGKVAADEKINSVTFAGPAITALHEPFTPQEITRYRQIARESAEIVHDLACWVEPGMTERKVLGHMWGKFLEHDFEGDCMFVVSDERIQRYRHAVPSSKKIENVVMIAPAVYKYGLHVVISRMVYFSPPSDDLLHRQQAVSTILSSMVNHAIPGTNLHDLLTLCYDLFDSLGFPEEKGNHMHGGPTGYRVGYPERCRDLIDIVQQNTALAWYITVRGAKTEEVVLPGLSCGEIISLEPKWPMVTIQHNGFSSLVPDILRRY
jgi:Xaa-Pro dipeptidase